MVWVYTHFASNLIWDPNLETTSWQEYLPFPACLQRMAFFLRRASGYRGSSGGGDQCALANPPPPPSHGLSHASVQATAGVGIAFQLPTERATTGQSNAAVWCGYWGAFPPADQLLCNKFPHLLLMCRCAFAFGGFCSCFVCIRVKPMKSALKSMPPVPRHAPTPPSGWLHLSAGPGPASTATKVESRSEGSSPLTPVRDTFSGCIHRHQS